MKLLFTLLLFIATKLPAQELFEKEVADSLNYYEWHNKQDAKKRLLTILSAKKLQSSAVLCYFEQTLTDCPYNSILFTNGSLDTYTLWMLQSTKNLRGDVVVVRLKDIMKGNYTISSPLKKIESRDLPSLILSIEKEGNHKNILFTVTINGTSLKSINANLYLTGLAYQYKPKSFDNIAAIEKNLSTICLNEEQVPDDSAISIQGSKLERNYIPGLILLYRKYKTAGDNNTALQYSERAKRIATRQGLIKELEKQLAK